MSKGGAGKVYFVLYLAVILELLIIFIERDEAEEGLNRERQQAIQVVQTILSQLQTGSGSEGITATPKDNIVLNDKDPQSNARNYEVTVSVGDPKAKSVVNGQEIRGDDVSKLEYIVSHIGNDLLKPEDLGADSADIDKGQVIFKSELGTEIGSYTVPRQTYGSSIPAADIQHYFALNEQKTQDQVARGKRVKIFTVNFKPNQGKGWYRLRFNSETNKILGITGGAASDNDTVRIGNVKLSVKQLRQVQKALRKSKTGVGDEASRVEQYIDTLLTPGAYRRLRENLGSKGFDVHVTVPDIPPPSDPHVAIKMTRDTAYWYDVAPFSVQVAGGPAKPISVQGASVTSVAGSSDLYLATITNPAEGLNPIIATAKNENGKMARDEKVLMVEKPDVKGGVDKWKGNKATVTKKYNPSSDWKSTAIAPEDYQTVVEIKGKTVFDSPGTSFKDADLPVGLVVAEGTTDKDIKTIVYWKPNKTADRSQWKPLLSNVAGAALLTPSKPFTLKYPDPEQQGESEFTWTLTAKNMTKSFEGIVLRQQIGPNQYVGVQTTAQPCDECDAFGIRPTLEKVDETTYTLKMEVGDKAKLAKKAKELRGKRFDISYDMDGRGGAKAPASFSVTVQVP